MSRCLTLYAPTVFMLHQIIVYQTKFQERITFVLFNPSSFGCVVAPEARSLRIGIVRRLMKNGWYSLEHKRGFGFIKFRYRNCTGW